MMEQTKTEFKWFSIPQYRQEENYLSSMHKKGWELTKITFPGIYKFKQCEPENVTYRLDYNQDGVAHKSEYVQMFSDCGWEYLFDFVGYSYFRKASAEDEPNEEIFCDDESRLDMMKRVFRGRVIPLIIIFGCNIFPQLFINMGGYGKGNIVQQVLFYVLFALGLLYIILFGSFAIQFYQYEKSVYPERNLKMKYVGIFAGLFAAAITMIGVVVWSHSSNYEIIEKEHGFTLEARLLNESVIQECELHAGDTVYFSHEGDGGELYISIRKEDEYPLFYGNTFDEFGKFSVEIDEDGVYQIEFSGKRATGRIVVDIE